MNFEKKLDKLRTILEKKKNKEDISESELAEVGLTSKSRIKDIEKEIKAVRSQVSKSIKVDVHEEVEKDLIAELEELRVAEKGKYLTMTLEEYKTEVAENARAERQKKLVESSKISSDDHSRAVAVERRKKEQVRTGDDYE